MMADAPFVEDVDVYPLMLELIGCLCEELEKSGLPKPCRCGIQPGSIPVIDFAGGDAGCKDGCGQAWVRLVQAFPSTSFPEPDFGTVQACAGGLAYELEVGLSRCEASGRTVNGRFIPPTLVEQMEAVRLYTADMAAMRRAIVCCLRGEHERAEDLEVALGTYRPMDSQGGTGGGIWQVFLARA